MASPKKSIRQGVVGFLVRAVEAVMGCLFCCFRITDSPRKAAYERVSSQNENQNQNQNQNQDQPWSLMSSDEEETDHSAEKEPVLPSFKDQNHLASLFSSDEEESDDSAQSAEKSCEFGTPQHQELDVNELKDQAKFLKACGTLPETPIELRKPTNDPSPPDQDETSFTFTPWSHHTCAKKLNSTPDQLDSHPTPITIFEEWKKGTGSMMNTPTSSIQTNSNENVAEYLDVHDDEALTLTPEISLVSQLNEHPTPVTISEEWKKGTGSMNHTPTSSSQSNNKDEALTPETSLTSQRKNKSVRFDIDSERSRSSSSFSSSWSGSSSEEFSGPGGKYSLSRSSPYPTPLKLSEEMQTPGTVFPAYLENTAYGKGNRIRAQYVYPVEDFSRWKVPKNGDDDDSDKVDEGTNISTPMSGMEMKKELSSGKDTVVNLSSSIEPHANNEDAHCGGILEERPILGLVATHWNDDRTSHVTPSWCNRNGIPNSTRKYNEDQKVRWHATPFEERLDKALSEGALVSQRKPASVATPPIEFDEETDERDASISPLPSSADMKPVVSF